MTQIPQPELPLMQRLLLQIQTLQFVWFLGHACHLISVIRYLLLYITFNSGTTRALLYYKIAFLGSIATYGIVVGKGYNLEFRAHRIPPGLVGFIKILTDENVQYLLMAIMWFVSGPVTLALLPFSVYSLFHVLTYVRANLLPAIFPAPPGKTKYSPPLSDTIRDFIKARYGASMTAVALMEIALWFRLLGSALLFRPHSFLRLALYTLFFRVRWQQNNFEQHAVAHLVVRIDSILAQQRCPVLLRSGWEKMKLIAARFVKATDLQSYMNKTTPLASKSK